MSDWKQIASRLRIGESRKVSCCGSSPSAYVSYTPHGLRFGPCFRCGHTEFVKHDQRSAAEIMAARRIPAPTKTAAIPAGALPLSDASVPSIARLFVLKIGWSPEAADYTMGTRYDTQTQRLLFPIPEGYMSRSLSNAPPKWIKYGASEHSHVMLRGTAATTTCVVVEDLLSGYAVQRAGYTACVVLGTSVTDAALAGLARYESVLGWFDNDPGGDKGFRTLRKRLGVFGIDPQRIRTAHDPKIYSANEIRRFLNAGHPTTADHEVPQ